MCVCSSVYVYKNVFQRKCQIDKGRGYVFCASSSGHQGCWFKHLLFHRQRSIQTRYFHPFCTRRTQRHRWRLLDHQWSLRLQKSFHGRNESILICPIPFLIPGTNIGTNKNKIRLEIRRERKKTGSGNLVGKVAQVDDALISSVMVYCLRAAVPTPQSEIVHISIIGERQNRLENNLGKYKKGGGDVPLLTFL